MPKRGSRQTSLCMHGTKYNFLLYLTHGSHVFLGIVGETQAKCVGMRLYLCVKLHTYNTVLFSSTSEHPITRMHFSKPPGIKKQNA